MGTALLRAAAVVAAALALGAATALAAPPTEPPGRSGDAPGHQKGEGSPAVDPSPPGHADEAAPEPSAPAEPAEPVAAAVEAAPESSVSAPGTSGRHKLTICHKGHAITVDVHAAQAHVDGHGDTYAPAGSKGRAACPQPSSAPPSPAAPADPSGPSPQHDDPAGARPADAPARAALVEDPAVAPAGPKDPAGGVTAVTSTSDAGGVASEVSGDTLPFTGGRVPVLALLGFALLALGAALLAAARRPAPAPSRRC